MATLIYTEQAGDKLKLLAEVDDNDVAMAVDALLDSEPKLASQQPFVCFPTDARIVVEAEEEVVQPRRRIKMNGKLGDAPAPQRKARTRKPAADADDTEEAAPKRRGRPPGTKNKTTVATDGDVPKRRGRPPGSKIKTTTAKAADTGEAPKRRGRPPGSKNKTTTASAKPAVKSAAKKTAIKTPFTRNAASDE